MMRAGNNTVEAVPKIDGLSAAERRSDRSDAGASEQGWGTAASSFWTKYLPRRWVRRYDSFLCCRAGGALMATAGEYLSGRGKPLHDGDFEGYS